MSKIDNDAAKQAAWEKVLRGEPLGAHEADDETIRSAETLRGIVLWHESQKEPTVDDVAREKQWRRLSAGFEPARAT